MTTLRALVRICCLLAVTGFVVFAPLALGRALVLVAASAVAP
jgi:hypothetical protein